MLVIESGPNAYGPSPLGQPAEWIIYNDGLRSVIPQKNTYIIRITATSADGLVLVVGGQSFTTDSGIAYSNTSWDASSQIFLSAFNLANALRSNAAFRSYTVKTARPSSGQPWRVIAVAVEPVDATATDGNNTNIAGVAIEQIAGRAEVRTSERLWFQFWGESGPVTVEKYAPFDQNGRVTVDADEIARRVLSASAPDPEQVASVLDLNASAYLSLKFGTYLSDSDCSPSFGAVQETGAVPFVNAVFQHDEVNGFDPFSPVRTLGDPLKWMSRRKNNRTVNRYGYEWSSIYLGPSPWVGGSPTRRLRKELFDAADNSLGVITEELNGSGVWRVPTGYQNAIPEGSGSVSYFTVVVQFDFAINSWLNESEVLTLRVVDQDCQEAEIYYLEGRGGWGTIGWDKLEQRTIAVSASSYERKVKHSRLSESPSASVLFDDGGTYQSVDDSATTFTLTSYFIKSGERKSIEEMLESPVAYLLTEDENGKVVTRRVIFNREEYRTEAREGGTKVSVSFTYSTGRRLR